MSYYDSMLSILEFKPTTIYGLKSVPQLKQGYDMNQDYPILGSGSAPTEISDCNRTVVDFVLSKLGDKCQSIVEIGVHRNGTDSISHLLLTKKMDTCKYLGIDVEDKRFLNDESKNIFTIQSNSHDQATIRQTMKKIGIEKIDLLMIDGWHSVNTCINDWCYADMLSDHGAVIFHDTNFHPGPISILMCIDDDVFKKERFCVNHNDNGIAVAWHKKQLIDV